jgi:rhamnosyltransferase subunit B
VFGANLPVLVDRERVDTLRGMANILLTTLGSYGDLHPFLAMARALRSRGDRVRLATHAQYREAVERLGVEFVAIPPSKEDVGPEELWAAEASHPRRGTQFVVRDLILPHVERSYELIDAAAADCDLIIDHLLTLATPLVAEKRRIRWLSTALQPSAFLSAWDPPALGPAWFLPHLRWLGPRLLGGIMRAAVRGTGHWFESLHALRKKVGLPVTRRNPLADGWSPYGTVALFDALFAAPQPDWPVNVAQVGFPLFDEETSAEGSPEVLAFLQSGPAPVTVTLGSAVVLMETPVYEVAAEALSQMGLRGVLLVGKQARRVPEWAYRDSSLLVRDYEPFSALFPQSAVVVHQCGIGTTGQALAAGRPQLCLPFAHDQPDNARRVRQLGLGETLVPRSLTVRRFRKSLERLVSQDRSPQCLEVAAEIRKSEFARRFLAAVDHVLDRPVG